MLQLREVAFGRHSPISRHDRVDPVQGEQSNLLHGLFVRAEVLAGQHLSVDQCLERVHAVEENHRLALVEYAELGDELGRELVQQACHAEVHE